MCYWPDSLTILGLRKKGGVKEEAGNLHPALWSEPEGTCSDNTHLSIHRLRLREYQPTETRVLAWPIRARRRDVMEVHERELQKILRNAQVYWRRDRPPRPATP
jgi:hypothetical protein